MLSLTRKCDYALIALAYLAQQRVAGETSVSARKIADAYGLPLPLLMNILKDLTHEHLVVSTRGPAGGYALANEPEQISLLAVIRAVDGPPRFARCADPLPIAGQECDIQDCCPVREPIQRLHERIQGFLAEVTLADLMTSKVDVPSSQVGVPALSNR
ncbi:MAG: Rrf2 family transcriptional regulator [Planctomycetota bacterium]|nr:Rrf2 family transcriptional regulator [Planctomycetota bacterium]